MKNDIDSILNSMFRDGRLSFRSGEAPKPAKAPEKAAGPALPKPPEAPPLAGVRQAQARNAQARQAVDAVTEAQKGMAESLQESIERMAREAQEDMAGLRLQLEQDGVGDQTARNGGSAQDIETAFQVARQEALSQILGQEAFLDGLTLAFKRPFVTGREEDRPLCSAALLGRTGSGRRGAVEALTGSLGRQGVLKSPKTVRLDLSAYAVPGSEKLFIQDLYAALKGGAPALIFENYQSCHPSLLPMLAGLFTRGSLPLPGRYAEQKGLLVDVGGALAPGAVRSLSAAGKYLFLLAGEDEAKLAGAFGSGFLAALDDVLRTRPFEPEDLRRIAQAELKALGQRAQARLGFQLSWGEDGVNALAERFDQESGAGGIARAAEELYRLMGEEKLKKSLIPPIRARLLAEEGQLAVAYEAEHAGGKILARRKSGTVNQAEAGAAKAELAGVVGLASVKDYILSLEDNFNMQQLRRQKGLKAETPSMHMIFTGNPGTGKTTVARIAARYLKAIGALTGGQLVEVTRADLVGQYVGHTAPLTQKAIQAAMGGVLFIDEAYSLYRGRDDSFGLEAIDALVKGMEDHRDRLIVILAGYSREMEEFLSANSGLRSRFPHIIEFPDYTAEELLAITESIARGMGYRLDPACKAPLLGYYEAMQLTGDPRVNGNGRMARNKVEAAVIACSRRNLQAPEAERDLELLLPEDFQGER